MDAGVTSEPIELRYRFDTRVLPAAMSGWWRSAVPPQKFVHRAVFWAVVWLGLFVLAGAIGQAGLSPAFVIAGILGAGVMVAAFAYLQRTRMRQFYRIVGAHWDRTGEISVRLDARGIEMRDDVSERRYAWAAIDAVHKAKGATVLRTGMSMIAIPDAALPEGLSASAFRARLKGWREL